MTRENKFVTAFAAAYNTRYAEFIRLLDSAEGTDAAHFVAAHSYAQFHAHREIAECKCYGSGIWWQKTAGTDATGNQILIPSTCFGCGGKGFQNASDQKRNWGYWNFYARIEA
jgi:hypothetical protein